MPNVPSFASRAERVIVTPTGASLYAAGSQVWNGQTGTFTMNPAIRARNSQNCSSCFAASCPGWPPRKASSRFLCTAAIRSGSANVCVVTCCPVGSRSVTGLVSTTPTTPTSVSRLPARV